MAIDVGSVLLERGSELAGLTAVVDSARRGSGRLAVIQGEAGIGKTALLQVACEYARATEMTVLRARGGELEREFAWGVVRQLFDPLLASSDDRGQDLLSEAAVLARPAVGLQTSAAAGVAVSFSTLHGLYWLTVNVAQRTPTLIAVDDAHWADRPSLRFLVHLAARLAGLPVTCLVVTRPVGTEPSTDTELLARLARGDGAELFRPAALSDQASAELVRGYLSPEADEDYCLACHEMSGGNPFLLRSLIDALAAEGTDPTMAGAARVRRMTPEAVSHSVLVRLAALPPGALKLARAVSAMGAQAQLRHARRLAKLGADEAAVATGALARAGILRGESVLEFVHPLVRAAVYSDLSAAERGRWHERAADLLAAEGAPAEELIPHLLASLPDGNSATVERLRAGATEARARGAPEVAADCLERALAEPPQVAARIELLFELGQVRAMQDPKAAVSPLSEAFATDAEGPRRAAVALALGDALTLCGRLSDAIPVLQRGLAELTPEPSELRAPLEANLIAAARWDASAQDLRHETVERVRRRAEAGEQLDPWLHAQLAIEATAEGIDRATAVHHARTVIAAANELATVAASTVPEAALVLAFADLAEEARQATDAWLAQARRLGWPLAVMTGSTCGALSALYRGAISEAIASARGASTPGADIRLAPIVVAFLIEALIERGETAAAVSELTERGLDHELSQSWATTPLLLARGRLHAARDEHPRAIADLLATGERAEAWGVRNPAMTPWRSSAAISLAAVGERAEALRLAGEEVELAKRWGAGRAIGVALRAAGVACGDRGGLTDLGEAVTVLADAPAPVELARALTDLGALLRRLGERAEAREHLRRGLDIAHRNGALALAERAREELIIAGARPRRDALRGRDSLTASEHRITALAAQGRTNNQIAQALFITSRTVETHLTSAYAKLGISSRRELATALES